MTEFGRTYSEPAHGLPRAFLSCVICILSFAIFAFGEELAFAYSQFIPQREQLVQETESAPATAGRTGVAIGILVVTLLALAFYFYWRTTGARDEDGPRPQPVSEVSTVETPEAITLMG